MGGCSRRGWPGVSADQVRELTVGVRAAVAHLPIAARAGATGQAVGVLLPLATQVTVADLRRAVGRLRFVLDPDGVRQAALDAYTEQSLTCVPVGHLVRVQAFLDPEAAAATMTVLHQLVERWARAGEHAGEDHPPTGSTRSPRRGGGGGGPVTPTCSRSRSGRP